MSSSATSSAITTDTWLEAASHRRSIYGLTDTSAIPDSRVTDIIKKVQSFAPSAYNTQTLRYTLATGDKHKQFWKTVADAASPIISSMPTEAQSGVQGYLKRQSSAYGSVVFWESLTAQQEGAKAHKSAATLFPEYGEHAAGIAQILVWTALELEGLGANLQHMQSMPPVEAALKEFCGVPGNYVLKGHLTYGDKVQPHPETPAKLPFEEVFRQI